MNGKIKLSSQDLNMFRRIPTASLSDALDRLGFIGFMNHDIKPIIGGKRIAGPAVTVLHVVSSKKEAPTKALEAIDSANPGDVIVIACEGDARNIALYGGLMATASKMKGLEGAVLEGGVRDVAEVKEMGFQIFSKSIVPSTSVGRSVVTSTNTTVLCGGVTVNPGDIVVGDDDGVVVIPIGEAAEVLRIALEIDEIERKEAAELRRGISLLETVKKYSRV